MLHKDRVAVITAGAGGFGSATALMMAREGAKVEIADIDREVLGTEVTLADLHLGETAPSGGETGAPPVVRIPPAGIPLEEVERCALVEALKISNWVQKDAADLLSISPRVINYKIKTLKIEFPKSRREQAAETGD